MASNDRNVVIAGGGIAAAALACQLRGHGFEVWLIERAAAGNLAGIEALPEPAIGAFVDLGLEDALARAGAVVGERFENAWEGPDAVRLIKGPWISVERTALGSALRAEAIVRGAKILRETPLPKLAPCRDPEKGFDWAFPGGPKKSMAAIDATGRAARWIGKTARRDFKVARLYDGPGTRNMRPGRVVRTETGWAYALFHPARTTVGLIDSRQATKPERRLPAAAAEALDLSEARDFSLARLCPAHAQWAAAPIKGRLLAIGDAAFACEPIAGQGVRFALSSAMAASAVLVNWRDGGPEGVANRYYFGMVDSARSRHLAQLDAINGGFSLKRPIITTPEEFLLFSGEIVPAGLRRGDEIVEDYCVRLLDGGLVRWLGTFDLLDLHHLAATPCRWRTLHTALRERGLASSMIESLLQWSVDRDILRQCPSP